MKSKAARQIDMLNGTLMDKILIFALPLAASSILQQLFNSADVAVAGRFAGSIAQAAVGVNSSVITLMINMFVGLSVGANVVIANYIGQRKENDIQDIVHTVIMLALISGFSMLVIGQFVGRPILTLMDTPQDIMDQAVIYLRIYFLGMPFIMIYNFGSAILRSVGDTKRPLYCLTASGILNVCLNLMFVIVFHMGASGVALATTLSNGASAGMIFTFLLREESMIQVDIHKLSINGSHLLRIIRIGVPAGIQGVVFSLSNVCIQTAVNSFGSSAIAGSAAAVNFEFFTYFMTTSFAQAAVTFTSQNFGARKFDRCKKVFRLSVLGGLLFDGIMCAFFVLARGFLLRLFTVDPIAIQYANIRVMRVESLAFIVILYEVTGGALRGMGYSMMPAVISIFGSCILRFVWVLTVFKHFSSFEMLMNVYPVSWIVTITMMIIAYFIIGKKVLRE